MTEATSKAGAAVLVPVLENNRFDEAALAKYLSAHVPGFAGDMVVQQFQGGFSNPTFHLQTRDHAYVLRKKPPGQLLPSAHAVDREYKVMSALHDTDVPVPRMHVLCQDESIIGTRFTSPTIASPVTSSWESTHETAASTYSCWSTTAGF